MNVARIFRRKGQNSLGAAALCFANFSKKKTLVKATIRKYKLKVRLKKLINSSFYKLSRTPFYFQFRKGCQLCQL